MDLLTTDAMWLFISYMTGSAVTGWMVYKTGNLDAISSTIDQLCNNGFLRHKKGDDGEVEIMKWNANDE